MPAASPVNMTARTTISFPQSLTIFRASPPSAKVPRTVEGTFAATVSQSGGGPLQSANSP